MKVVFMHSYNLFIHTFLTARHAFEQGFLYLSTVIPRGYYYYLYINETRSQANHTAQKAVFWAI
jgi:hypothetical protein